MNYENFKLSKPVRGKDGADYLLLQVKNKLIYVFKRKGKGKYEIIDQYKYKKDLKDLKNEDDTLYTVLRKIIGGDSLEELIKSTNSPIKSKLDKMENDRAYEKINSLIKDTVVKIKTENRERLERDIWGEIERKKEIDYMLLVNWLKCDNEFRLHENKLNRYILTENGYKEIDNYDIIELIASKFGHSNITPATGEKVLSMLAQKRISQNYNFIQFANGVLDTSTAEFSKFEDNKTMLSIDYLPKMECVLKFPECWEDWEQVKTEFSNTGLKEEISSILSCGWSWNEDLFYYYVANTLMATNELERLLIIYGESGTGKSTLATIFKRIFKGWDSGVKLQTINTNTTNGHDTSPLIDKCINIDDDIGKNPLKDTGNIKSFVTGGGFTVNPKNKNLVELDMFTTPKFIGCTNTLPRFEGEGHKRRLIIIQAHNKINDGVEAYQKNIAQGKRDEELALLVAYSLIRYYETKKEGKAIISSDMGEEMWDYYQSQLKKQGIDNYDTYEKAINECFIGKTEVLKRLDDLKKVGQIEDYEYKGATLRIFNNGKWEEIPNYTRKEDVEKIISEHIEKKEDSITINPNDIIKAMKVNYEYKQKRINEDDRDYVFTDCISKTSFNRLVGNVSNVLR